MHSEEKLSILILERGNREERVVFLKLLILVTIGNRFMSQSAAIYATCEEDLGKFVIIGRTIYLHLKYYRSVERN